MSETSIKTISDLLNEEKWTRATLNSYTINNFKELDVIVEKTMKEETQEEVQEICDEHLHHTKNSIIGLYLSGVISLNNQMVDDSNLLMVISIFSDNHKWNIVEYLCERILAYGENKYALRTLADCYENENEEEKKFEVWERLIKVDHDEADMVKSLAERKEAAGNIPSAVDLYKKAIHRYINKKSFSHVKDIWNKLIEYCPEDWEFFFHVDGKIAKTISNDRAAQLMEELYLYHKNAENWDKAIEILKRILGYDSKNQWARKEITECFEKKFSYHSQLGEYIRLSNLNQSWRNVHDAIADFEKHISFDVGNFVYHRTWGIGKIKSIQDDEIAIDFTRKRNHTMSLKMAVNALTYLHKEHIWVLKVTKKREDLRELVKADIPWTLKIIIKSYNNACSMKQVKAELVPGILEAKEWTSWSTAARKILKEDPAFGNLVDKIDSFMVRENPISKEEKTFNKFKAEKNFFTKYKTMMDFLSNSSPESELFAEIFSYFTNYLRAFNNVDAQVISSYFIIRDVVKKYPFLNPGFNQTFLELMETVTDTEELFLGIDNPTLKQCFLEELKEKENWAELYVQLFPKSLNAYIVSELEGNDKKDLLKMLFTNIIDNYKETREAFIWLARNHADEEWCESYGFRYEKILIGMLHLLDITFREINNRREVSLNRKLNKQILNYLFKDDRLEDYITNKDEDSVSRIYTLIDDVKDLDPSVKNDMKQIVIERFPNIKFFGEEIHQEVVSRGLLVLEKSFKAKQKAYQHIIDVEIPENSREIGAAIELGDLSENAEYKAGKEKQELLNISANKMKEEIEKANIFDPSTLNTEIVSFGTKATMLNQISGKEEEYIFLGPWESDPSVNIISYLAPLGIELMGHKKDEELEFQINNRDYRMKILNIEKADF
ncbi:MAG: transcription elongation factor GreA [Spirochaetales bacterium]|nr:transcription elongation factor GreA [Spirochaetales bacterium]